MIFPAAIPALWFTAKPFATSLEALLEAIPYFSLSSSFATVTSTFAPLNTPSKPFAFTVLTFISTMPSPSSFFAYSIASSFVFP